MGRSGDDVDDHLLRGLDILLGCRERERRGRESQRGSNEVKRERRELYEHPVISMMESPSRGMKMSAPDSALNRETVAPLVPTILALRRRRRRRSVQGRVDEEGQDPNSQGRLRETSDDSDETVRLGGLDGILDGLDSLVESLLVPRLESPLDGLVSLSSVTREDLEDVVDVRGVLLVLVDVDSTVRSSVGGRLGRSGSLGLGRSGRGLDDDSRVSKVSEEESSVADNVVDELLRHLNGGGELVGLSFSRSSSSLSLGLFLENSRKREE